MGPGASSSRAYLVQHLHEASSAQLVVELDGLVRAPDLCRLAAVAEQLHEAPPGRAMHGRVSVGRETCSNACGRCAAEGFPACCRPCTESCGLSHGPRCEAAWRASRHAATPTPALAASASAPVLSVRPAAAASIPGTHTPSALSALVVQQHSSFASASVPASCVAICIRPGCNNPSWNGQAGAHCSRSCKRAAALVLLPPRQAAIKLVSVRWMRAQWDPRLHCPVPGSWLAAYVVEKKIKTFPRCQDLPAETTKDWGEVAEDKRVAVSHMWQDRHHPTPDGCQFSEILEASRRAISILCNTWN